MKSSDASSTAQAASAVRALESLLPEKRRLFEDPFAQDFLHGWTRFLLGMCRLSPWLRDQVENVLDKRYPGVPADFICRTRFIDDAILATNRQGRIERLVIVGAGYDTRALRLSLPHEVEIIEVDHPATQIRKSEIANQRLATRPERRLRWLAHDLIQAPETSPDLQALFDRPARTFWIAEGVLSYLPRQAVSRLLSWIGSKSTAGSRFALTYVEAALVQRRSTDPAGMAILRYLDRAGEPFLSGWTPEDMAKDCMDAGLLIEEDFSESELTQRYLMPLGRKLKAVKDFRVVLGRVR